MRYIEFEGYPIPYDRPTTKRGRFDAHNDYKRAVRRDPCSYCPGPGGTVDHIIPKSAVKGKPRKSRPHVAGPPNWAGACLVCNQAKGHSGLLHFMYETLS